MTAVGVDGCRGGWAYVTIERNGRYGCGVAQELKALIEQLPRNSRAFVDIPIGLPEKGTEGRECDILARRLLARRRASIFPAPVRPVLTAGSYEMAKRISRSLTGKALSLQSYNLVPKIREVDRLLRESEAAGRILRESHPELCFRFLAGGVPACHSKKTEAGFSERLAVIGSFFPQASEAVTDALSRIPRKEALRDDIMDAMINAVAAAFPVDRIRDLPENPPLDSMGLMMRISYAVPRMGG